MQHWTFWDRLTYVCIWVAAVIIAADTAIRLSPGLVQHLEFLHGPVWGFAPLTIMIVGALILSVRRALFTGRFKIFL